MVIPHILTCLWYVGVRNNIEAFGGDPRKGKQALPIYINLR